MRIKLNTTLGLSVSQNKRSGLISSYFFLFLFSFRRFRSLIFIIQFFFFCIFN